MSSRIVFLLLYLAGGLWTVFITPPWQMPDEPTHLEHVLVNTTHPNRFWITQPDEQIQQRILESMHAEGFYRYVGIWPHYEPVSTFKKNVFFWRAPTKMHNPPLYYYLTGIVLRVMQFADTPIEQLYVCRLFSLLLGVMTVWLGFFAITSTFEGNERRALVAMASLALLPQFITISSSVNSDALANLLVAASIALVIRIPVFQLSRLPVQSRQMTVFVSVAIMFIVFASICTKRTALFSILFIVSAIIFSLFKLKKKKLYYRTLFYVAITFIISTVILIVTFKPLRQFIWKTADDLYYPLTRLLLLQFDPANYFHQWKELFIKSYFFKAGMMRFDLPEWMYLVAMCFVAVSIAGWLRDAFTHVTQDAESSPPDRLRKLMLLFSVFVIGVVSVRGLSWDQAIQGRYLFPALPALTVVFAHGYTSIWPLKWKKAASWVFIVWALCFSSYSLGYYQTKIFNNPNILYDKPSLSLKKHYFIDQNLAAFHDGNTTYQYAVKVGSSQADTWVQCGWYSGEMSDIGPLRWSYITGSIRFPYIPQERDVSLKVTCFPISSADRDNPELDVLVNNRVVKSFSLERKWQEVSALIKAELLSPGSLLALKMNYTVAPDMAGISNDKRGLSLAVTDIVYTVLPKTNSTRRLDVTIDDNRETFQFPGDRSLAFDLEIKRNVTFRFLTEHTKNVGILLIYKDNCAKEENYKVSSNEPLSVELVPGNYRLILNYPVVLSDELTIEVFTKYM